jgi:hypothetical protein
VQEESGVFRKILELFGHFSKALDWVCGFSKRLGFKSTFGLKRKVGDFVAGWVIKGYKSALKGFRIRLRVGSSRLVFKPNAKRVIGPDLVFGPVAYSVDTSLEPSLGYGADAGRVSGPGASRSLQRPWMLLWLRVLSLRWVMVRVLGGSRSQKRFQVCGLRQ